MDCKEIKEKLISCSGQTEGSEECASIKEHLAVCPNCRQEWEAYAGIFAGIGEVMEDSAAKASPSPNAWAGIKTQLTEKRSRIPAFASIKSKLAGWGRKFWSRPVWQRAVSVVSVAAIIAALVITQRTVGLSPGAVIARAQGAAAKVDSYHVTRIMTNQDNGETIRQETDYVAPNRQSDIVWVNDVKVSESRTIGALRYYLDLETGEWELIVDSMYDTPMLDMGDMVAVLGDFTEVQVFADEVIDSVICRRHKASFYVTEWDASLLRRDIERETDPAEIEKLERRLASMEEEIAQGDLVDSLVLEYWIGKDDYLLRKLDYVVEGEQNGEPYTASAVMTYSQINEPMQIAAPLGAPVSARLTDPDISVLSKIVCVSGNEGNQEIYVMDDDGTDLIRLTDNGASDREPVWSPDGSQIAFVSDRDGQGDVYVMDADGSNQSRLTTVEDDRIEPRHLKWSPDGSKISYWHWGAHIMNPDGSDNIEVPYVGPYGIDQYAWSPDSTKIAYKVQGGIYVVNADGFDQAELLFSSTMHGNDNYLAWSPDGSKIAFYYSANIFDDEWKIRVMNANGTNLTTIADEVAFPWGLAWSPDSSKLLYSHHGIRVTNADGTGDTEVALGSNPTWSIDGTKVIYNTSNENIWMVDIDGTNPINLTDYQGS